MSMIHIRHTFSALLFLTATASMMSCSDKLFEENNTPADNKDISFTVQTNESSELTNVTPETRAAIAVQTGERPYLLSLKDGEQEIPLRASTVRYMEMDQRRGTVDIEAANVEGGTRTTPKTTATFYSDFGVSAYRYASTWVETLTPNHMYNVQMTNSSGIYRNDANSNFWPASGKLRFFAYAPYADATYLKMSSASTATGFPTLSYTVPTTVTAQKDVMVADQEVTCSGTHAAQPLAFDHALTAVNFAVGNLKKGTIKKITISGVYGAGTYSYKKKAWTTTGSANASYSVSPNYTTANRSLASNVFITSGDNTLLMIPQTLPTSATVSIEFLFDGEASTRTLTAKLSSDGKAVWAKGTTVTYTVSTTSVNNVLIVTSPTSFSYNGGTHAFTVQSYKWTGDGGQTAVPWTTVFKDVNGNTLSSTQRSWIKLSKESDNGSASATSYNAICSAQSSTSMSHTNILKQRTAKGTSSNPYDLSKHDHNGYASTQNTANCYIVDAPGYYKLPLVYGNAIKNGAVNTNAFKSSASGSNVLKVFKDHNNTDITSPYIYSKYSPAIAAIVWNDNNNIVKDVALTDNNTYIKFTVDKNTIIQGNSLICVMDANKNILWSWHIWITDQNVYATKTVTNHSGIKYDVMPVTLGWTSVSTTSISYYAPRNVQVTFTQSGSNAISSIITISQLSGDVNTDVNTGGYAAYYQWGRKDPMVPSDGTLGGDKATYNSYTGKNIGWGTLGEDTDLKTYTIGESIQNPGKFLGSLYDNRWNWCNTDYYNLWSANTSKVKDPTDQVVKTVYDPCPVGFSIPPLNVFSGFTKTGTYTDNTSNINVQSKYNSGYFFYCNNGTGELIFFPALSCRISNSGKLVKTYIGQGYYWEAVTGQNGYPDGDGTSNAGLIMRLESQLVAPIYGERKCHAMSVRPAREYGWVF